MTVDLPTRDTYSAALPRHFVTGDGTRLYVEDTGPVTADVTVVLLHGWTQDHTCWNKVVERLPDGLRVLRYDHRGHGRSDPAKPATATITQVADDLAELIEDRVPAGRIVLAGHSMGGATIMAFVRRHPELVARISGTVFVSTTSGGLSELTFGFPRVLAQRVIKAEARISPLLTRSKRQAFARRPAILRPVVRRLTFGKHADAGEVRSTAAQIGRCHPASMIGFLDSLLVHDRRADLAALRGTPSAVLVGTLDKLCPRSHSRVLADELPDARYLVFPGAGHMLPSERPDEVADQITQFAR
jgi:pimeloyl-ACP methyl ester carboxylesterase